MLMVTLDHCTWILRSSQSCSRVAILKSSPKWMLDVHQSCQEDVAEKVLLQTVARFYSLIRNCIRHQLTAKCWYSNYLLCLSKTACFTSRVWAIALAVLTYQPRVMSSTSDGTSFTILPNPRTGEVVWFTKNYVDLQRIHKLVDMLWSMSHATYVKLHTLVRKTL
jgi:hypothetical protein